MDQQRIEAYLNLINTLLLNCESKGELKKILNDNQELIDSGLSQTMFQEAQKLASAGNQDRAEFLLEMANYLKSQDYTKFLMEVLQATQDSDGDSKVVYPLLQQNLNKLDNNFADILQNWATAKFLEVETYVAESIAAYIGNFSILIKKFPLGNKANNMEISIAGYEVMLKVFTYEGHCKIWATIQNNLGNAYRERIMGNKAENIESAITAFQNALLVRTKTDFPIDWAMTQNNIDWAMTQNNLGITYTERIMGDKAENIESAITAFQNALEVRTKTDFPIDWAATQNNLGAAYRERIRGDKAENIESAIAAYQQALLVRTKTDFPIDWAATQNNLGNAYSDRIRGDKIENIESAIAASQQALLVHTKTDFPINWAATQNNLGNAYSDRIRGDKAENIESAIAAFQQALLVYTKTDFPIDWAATQNNLGAAYRERIRGDKAENIESAIAASQQALLVHTKTDFSIQWATSQNNLGAAYRERIKGDKAENIESAIAAFQQALLFYTKTDFPIDWAMTQNNLGLAYRERIKGNKAENIESAIAAFQNALEVRTLEANPLEHLRTTNNLGNLYFDNQNWQLATDNYEKAIKAVEDSRSWASTDENRQEVIAQAIQVYRNQVQAYINLEQWDKVIETAERSKARTLVELLVKRELYPQGNVPEEIIAELDRLRRNIPSLERQLQIVIEQRSASSGKSEVQEQQPLETSQKLLQEELEKSRQELDEVLNQIKDIDSSFTLTERVEPILFRDIQNLLDRDTAMIEWYMTDSKIVSFIITANSQHPIVEEPSAENLDTFINWANNYLREYYLEKDQWIKNLPSNFKRLAEILNIDRSLTQIDNIFEKQGIKCNCLILIPHRELHLFPLHAMPLENGDLLIDRFDRGISYAPSSQILQLTQKQKRPHFSQLFAVQNPTEDLIYADLEVETIRDHFDSAEVLIRNDASETKVKTNPHFQSSHCSHFSCHGNFNTGIAYASGLSLAKDDSPENGELTLAEIFGLKLSQCRLVTLSACETGLIKLNSFSDEYVGLPSGFIFAGSPSVVCSLWTVDQVSTAFLLIKFYQNLKSYPELGEGTVAIALKDAQMWLRNLTSKEGEEFLEKMKPYIDTIYQGKPKILKELFVDGAKTRINSQPHPFNSPFYWAAFTAVGF
ncbi:MAG: tetratricopeptide repeat protein [Okeania sp. SIO3B3]|nr:tetratricopeptide repeat protein [Okeania sp. SIO3B3]